MEEPGLWNQEMEVSCSVMSDSLRPHGLWPTDSSVHGISQLRILEWVAISFSRKSLCLICCIFHQKSLFIDNVESALYQKSTLFC